MLAEWTYLAAMSVAAGAVLAGVVAALWVRAASGDARFLSLPASVTLVVVGVVALAVVAESQRGASELQSTAIDLRALASDVSHSVGVASALMVGVLVPAAAIVLRGRRATTQAVLLGAVVVAGTGTPLSVTAVLTQHEISGPGHHPPGTADDGFEVTRLSEDARFSTSIAVTSSGDILFTEMLSGRVALLRPAEDGTPTTETVFEVPLPEGGRLFHLVLHPDWPAQPYVYLSAQHDVEGEMRLQVARIRVDDWVGSQFTVLMSGLPTEQPGEGDHFGSALAACGDTLYLSIGDIDGRLDSSVDNPGDRRRLAQMPSRLEGKILRYQLDGADLTAAGVLPSAAAGPLFALGFRNPFGMACDPETGLPVVVDNGPAGHDQVRFVDPGSNHEWPFTPERERLVPPAFDSGGLALGPTAVVVRGSGEAKEVIFASFHSLGIYRLSRADGAWTLSLLHEVDSPPLGLALDRQDCIYVSGLGSIWRIDEPGCS